MDNSGAKSNNKKTMFFLFFSRLFFLYTWRTSAVRGQDRAGGRRKKERKKDPSLSLDPFVRPRPSATARQIRHFKWPPRM